jgi:hypothetical protein
MRNSYPSAQATTTAYAVGGTADAAAAAAAVAATGAGGMAAVGFDITDKKNTAARRMRKGECPTCGAKTHKVNLFGKRTALSIDGIVLYGQCLICHPIEGYTVRPQSSAQNPHLYHPQQQQLQQQQQQYQHQIMTEQLQQQQQLMIVPINSLQQPPQVLPSIGAMSPIPQQRSHHQLQQQQQQQQLSGMTYPPMSNGGGGGGGGGGNNNNTHRMQIIPQHREMSQVAPPPIHLMTQGQQQLQSQQPQSHQPPVQIIAAPQQPQQQQQAYPPIHIHDEDDNCTVVSAITMDLRLIQGARNWDANQQGMEGYDSDQYDEEGMPEPPPVSRRPQASVGGDDPYAEGARPDPQEQLGVVVPPAPRHRATRSSGYVGGGGGGGPALYQQMAGGVGTRHPNQYGSLARGTSERLPPTRGISPIQEQQQSMHNLHKSYGHGMDDYAYSSSYGGNKNNMYGGGGGGGMDPPTEAMIHANRVAGLDADGYPISDGNYGWDRTTDLLPPGGMDALFRHGDGGGGGGATPGRTPLSPRTPGRRTSAAVVVEEITFNPAAALPTPAPLPPPPPLMERQLSKNGPHFKANVVPQRQPSRSQQQNHHHHQPQPPPSSLGRHMHNGHMDDEDEDDDDEDGQISIDPDDDMSPLYDEDFGPSYQLDDDDEDEDLPNPPLNSGMNNNNRGGYKQSPPTAAGTAALLHHSGGNKYPTIPPAPHSGNSSGGPPPAVIISATGGAGAAGRKAPPLMSRDRRGRPDDDMIQDGPYPPNPSGGLKSATSRQMALGGGGGRLLRDDDEDYDEDEDDFAPPTLAAAVSRPIISSLPTQQHAAAAAFASAMPVSSSGANGMTNNNPSNNNNNNSMGSPAAPSAATASNMPAPSSDAVKVMYRALSNLPNGNSGNGGRQMKPQTVNDIPTILHCLNLVDTNSFLREKAFGVLTDIVWKSGDKAKDIFVKFKGVDTLVKAMWDDMGNANVQEAAAQFLFSLAASTDGSAANDILSNEESVSIALLFSLQSHPHVENIQLAGCGILSCLAAASANNKNISDGTLSGALEMVLNAMATHCNSKGMQKAGLQALYSQCALSANAESNKRRLVETRLDDGTGGLMVIFRSIVLLTNELISLEWAFKLCWCLTSNEDLAKALSDVPDVLPLVADTCYKYLGTPAAGALVEASFGILGNLAHLKVTRDAIYQTGAVGIILDGMKFHRSMAGVSLEGCAALANLGVAPHIREDMNQVGAAKSVVSALQSFLDHEEVVEEAVRALVVMSIDSEDAKEMLTVPQVLATISEASERHETNSSVQEMVSCLIASMAVGTNASTSASRSDIICQHGGIDIVVRALGFTKGEKVLEAATNAYRNLACQAENQTDRLLKGGAARKLVKAMEANEKSLDIQMNACCSLWYLSFKAQERITKPGSSRDVVDSTGIKCIVKAIQTHTESGDLLELACGALWSLVDESIELKKDVVASGAIDAVITALLMHPHRTTTLEKACGVLANVSGEAMLAGAIAEAQGVSIVVEAMRNNISSISLLEIGAIVLRNIVSQDPDPELCEDASGAVSTLINAMKDHPKAVAFQREACSLLWVLAALSESCESKIVALDGILVLMKSIENNSDVPDVKEAALGAFNQLAKI